MAEKATYDCGRGELSIATTTPADDAALAATALQAAQQATAQQQADTQRQADLQTLKAAGKGEKGKGGDGHIEALARLLGAM